MANELLGSGVTLGMDNGVAGYNTIAQVRDISGPSGSVDTIDITTRDSANIKEYLGGLRDEGEVTFDILFDPDEATHTNAAQGLTYNYRARVAVAFQLTFPDATPTTATFSAIITALDFDAPLTDALMANVTLKITGDVTWA